MKTLVLPFNEGWLFAKEGEKLAAIGLPHDAMLREKREASCPSKKDGAFFPGGKYHYEKSFQAPEDYREKSVRVRFEGIYRNTTVFLNGQRLLFHPSGWSEFEVELAPFLTPGENHLALEVDNSLVPSARWYTGSGVYRDVSLVISDKRRIEDVFVRTLSVDPPTIEVSAKVHGEAIVEIYDGEKRIAASSLGSTVLPGARLWSQEKPALYRLLIRDETDEISFAFGIRQEEWSPEKGLLINGERVLLRGACLHSDNGLLGAREHPDAAERKIKILKQQGFNAIRCAHNPCSRALLCACDRLGMLVLDEAFDGWYIPKDYHDYSRDFAENWRDDLRAMVLKDRNHPSVIMYSIGNEVSETAESRGVALAAEMRALVRSLDSSRPVTCAVNLLLDVFAKRGFGVYKDRKKYERKAVVPSGFKDQKSGSSFFNAMANRLGWFLLRIARTRMAGRIGDSIAPSLDVLGLNYGGSRYDIDVKKYPARMMLGTETMLPYAAENWERVERHPQIFGDFVWAGFDYLGEACFGDWTYHSYPGLPLFAGQGMIDATGLPEAEMAYLQLVWGLRKEPYLAVSPLNHSGETPSQNAWRFTDGIASWSWRGYVGKKAFVDVFADGDSAELRINGRKVGRKKLKAKKARFGVRYENGEVEALIYDREKRQIGRASLHTGGAEAQLEAICEPSEASLSKKSLFYVDFSFVDSQGSLKPDHEEKLTLEVKGDSAHLLGFGSARCKTEEGFLSLSHHAYRGRAQAIFEAVKAGKTTVHAASESGFEKDIVLEVKP
jgi:beta-galactosidase